MTAIPGGYLVGSALLYADASLGRPGYDVVVGCLLLAEQAAGAGPARSAATGAWGKTLIQSMTSMGWTLAGLTSNQATERGGGTEAPWVAIAAQLEQNVDPSGLGQLGERLAKAPSSLRTRWQHATSYGDNFGSVLCVAGQDASGDCTLVVNDNWFAGTPGGLAAHPVGFYPWAPLPAGGTLSQAQSSLLLAASSVEPLRAAIQPKVAPAEPSLVFPIP